MKNIGLIRYKKADINNFTSATGLKIRQLINKPLRFILKLATNGKIIVENYPKLEKDKPYIFAATHSFVEEVCALLATIDRNAYSLIGTTEQLEHNPKIYANWLTGFIYVNREDPISRKESLPKMEKVINSGSSILIFPEGGWNNTENLLVQNLFPGVYYLAKATGAKVVPISTFNEFNSKEIYIKVGEPIDLSLLDKKEALIELRDYLATMKYEQIEKYSTLITRDELGEEPRIDFMEERKKEYLRLKWTKDVWEEELTVYKDKNNPSPEEIRASFDNVEITKANAYIMAPILVKRKEDKKYNFKEYMHDNWNK